MEKVEYSFCLDVKILLSTWIKFQRDRLYIMLCIFPLQSSDLALCSKSLSQY